MYDFNVVEKLVQVQGTDTIIPKRKVIVREDTGTPLSIVSDKYHVIKHADMVNAFEAALAELPSFRDYTVTTNLPYDGGQMFRKYTFNQINLEPKVGDVVKMTAELMNSYDGKTKGGYKVGGHRLACLNGQVVPGTFQEILTKHFANFKIERIVEGLKTALPLFEDTVRQWTTWNDVVMNVGHITAMLEKTAIPEKTRKKMVEKFATEDQTKFGAFQAMTWVITHETKARVEANNRVPQLLLERQIAPLFYGN
jgi:hypothetical protein